MAAKFNVTGEQRDDIDGQMIEIKRQLRLKSGSPINPELVKLALQNIVECRFKVGNEIIANPSILRLISGGEKIIMEASDGSRLICEATNVFTGHIDPDFVKWGLNKKGVATLEMPMEVHEMINNGTFMDIFQALPGNWNEKWCSQHQVIKFCELLPEWLRQQGYATIFLVKKDENKPIDEDHPEENLVVVLVHVSSDGLSVSVNHLEYDLVWDGEVLRRVVSPQLPIPLDK